MNTEHKKHKRHKKDASCASCVPFLSVSRHHRDLELAIAILHMREHLRQFAQTHLSGDEIARADFSAGDDFKSLAYETRRVMKAGFDRNLRIVEGRGLKFHFRSPRTSAKEVDCSTASDDLHRPLPRRGRTNRFDDAVCAESPMS